MITDINNDKMEHQWYDLKSWAGTTLTFIMGFIGISSLNDLATFAAILTGFATTLYTGIKIYKELKIKK